MTGPIVIVEPSPDTPLVWFDILTADELGERTALARALDRHYGPERAA